MKRAIGALVVVLVSVVAVCAFERSARADDGCGNSYYNNSYYNPCPSPTYYYPPQTTYYYQQPYYYTTPTTYYQAPTTYYPAPTYHYQPPVVYYPQPCYAPPTYYRPVYVPPYQNYFPVIRFDFGGHHNRRCR